MGKQEGQQEQHVILIDAPPCPREAAQVHSHSLSSKGARAPDDERDEKKAELDVPAPISPASSGTPRHRLSRLSGGGPSPFLSCSSLPPGMSPMAVAEVSVCVCVAAQQLGRGVRARIAVKLAAAPLLDCAASLTCRLLLLTCAACWHP